jgi:hypothetical protein
VQRLAADHGFSVEAASRLGRLTEVLAMLVSDASILPESRSVFTKGKVVALRLAAAAMVRVLEASVLSSGVAINSNCYLSNGVVLRAV